MSNTMERIQQEAYVRGQQMQQQHHQQQRVVNDETLTILAANFAHVYLFKSNQRMTVDAAHERAGLCMRAFEEGYRSQSVFCK